MAKRVQDTPAGNAPNPGGSPSIDSSLSGAPAVTAGELNSSQAANQNTEDLYSTLGLGPPLAPAATTTTTQPAVLTGALPAAIAAPAPGTGSAATPTPDVAPTTTAAAPPPAATPSPAPPASVPLSRTRSGARTAKVTDPTAESPSARAKKSKGPAAAKAAESPAPRATAKAADRPVPQSDALQAGLDSTGNRLTADEARILSLETSLNSHTARTKVQHDVFSKQMGAVNKETAASKLRQEIASRQLTSIEKDVSSMRRQQESSRSDMERLIGKMRNLETWMNESRELAGSSGLSAFAPDFMDTMDSAMAAARVQIQEGLDAIAVLRERVDAQDAKVDELVGIADEAQNSANLALEHTHRVARRLERHIESLSAAPGPSTAATRSTVAPAAPPAPDAQRALLDAVSHGLPPPPPPPPATGLRRKSYATESESEDEGRTRKAPRLIYDYELRAREPTFEGYHSYGHRRAQVDQEFAAMPREPAPSSSRAPTSAPAPTPSSDEFPHTYVSARVGSDSSEQSIAWGRRNDPPAMISRVTRWTLFMDPTGAIPVPVAAAAPPGMADNYRLITFHNNTDLVRFLAAWQNRPEALRRIIATPVPEVASTVTAPSSASLGLHPPAAGGSGNRRPSGSKDSRGNRPF